MNRRSLIIGMPALLLAGCGGSGVTIPGIGTIGGSGDVRTITPDINTPNSPWRAQNSSGVVMEHSQGLDGGFAFNFPRGDGVHYVTRPPPGPVSGIMTIRYRVDSTSPSWAFKGDAPPPMVTAFVQRKGDQLSGNTPDNRYWAGPLRGSLDPGEHVITAPLLIPMWTNVMGQRNDAGFKQTLNNCANVGMTFGGASFFGHGVWTPSGSARFTLLAFNIA